ncbi:MAG: type II secretion system protein [Bryobacteraceae bacterium]
MELSIRNGEGDAKALVKTPPALPSRRRFGFTLIELMIVMAIIAVLMAVALPIYNRSIVRSKESVLKNNLFTLRTVIDEYTYDKQKAPQTLEDLVTDGYLRQVPIDPMTGNSDSWKLIMEDASNTVNQSQPGIWDVRSGADGTSLEGTPYSEW